jgi:hypothetical protein
LSLRVFDEEGVIEHVLFLSFLLSSATSDLKTSDAPSSSFAREGEAVEAVTDNPGSAVSAEELALRMIPIQLRVRVSRGFANYVLPSGGRVQRLRPQMEPLWTDEGIYLEVGFASTIELLWNGAGSLRIEGPASLSWKRGAMELTSDHVNRSFDREEREKAAVLNLAKQGGRARRHAVSFADLRPSRKFASTPIQLVFGFVKSAEIEAHGPGMQISVEDCGWDLDAPSGAFRLESLKDQRLFIAHHGGSPIRIRSGRLRAPGKWPVRIRSGIRFTLPGPNEIE